MRQNTSILCDQLRLGGNGLTSLGDDPRSARTCQRRKPHRVPQGQECRADRRKGRHLDGANRRRLSLQRSRARHRHRADDV